MSLNEIYSYFRDYDRDSYEVYAQQGAEPSQADVAAFETLVGFSFPEEFRTFVVHPLGGLYMAVKEDLWPRADKYQVGPFWSFLYGLRVYSLSKQAPKWLQIEEAWRSMSQQGYPQFVPFLKILSDPDPFCFTREQRIVVWRHESPQDPEPVTGSFSEVLVREIHALEERKARKIRGEDKESSRA
jgi:hypothetical protein